MLSASSLSDAHKKVSRYLARDTKIHAEQGTQDTFFNVVRSAGILGSLANYAKNTDRIREAFVKTDDLRAARGRK